MSSPDVPASTGGTKLNLTKQACVQLPTSAVNVALPAFSAARRAAAPCCCGAGHAAIDRYFLPTRLTTANPPHAVAAGEWERQTDGQTDGHRIAT